MSTDPSPLQRPKKSLPQLLHSLLARQFVRFLLVGVLNTAFGYLCFAAFVWGGLHYAWALLLATVAGVLFNFLTTGRLVFGATGGGALARFVAVYAVVYTANVAGLAMLSKVGVTTYAGGAMLLLPVAFLSYFLNKKFVFRHG